MSAAIAVLGSVAMLCTSALVAWRWWLAHLQAKGETATRTFEKELAELGDMKRRLTALEYKR